MLTVVIVDDSDVVRGRVRELVSQVENVDVVGEACDGLEALQVVADLQPDVIILDIRMPRCNGIQTLETIKRGNGRTPVVIVLTAFATRQHRHRCLRSGAAHFFDKNDEFERVAEVLERLDAEGGSGPSAIP
ncbi:MAG: response regulator [Chloroflexota bacterium]